MGHEESSTLRVRRRRRAKRDASPEARVLTLLEAIQAGLIFALIIAAPWLFGTTEPWSVRLLNISAYLLGLCSTIIWFWDRREPNHLPSKAEKILSRAFLGTNIALLLYCIIAFFNARAAFSIDARNFVYRQGVIPWLPTSYDSPRTLQFLLNHFAFFCAFWSIRDWLNRGRTASSSHVFNSRMLALLWVFTVSGFLLGLQGLLQRLSNTPELLWFRTPYNEDPKANFGPFAYRGNAVDFLNMVWPVTFGFWYVLSHRPDRRPGLGDGPELLLLPMFLVTATASFGTLSRGGALVAVLMLFALAIVLLRTKAARIFKIAVAISVAIILLLALGLAGRSLFERFQHAASDRLSGRTEIYQNAKQMAADFPWFGTGPGTFLSVYHLYRQNPSEQWAAFLHDDWLETRVTFGRIGMSLVLIQLTFLAYWTLLSKNLWSSKVFTFSLFLALAGCLAHAKVDFPFQTYGITLTFVALCAILTAAHRPELPQRKIAAFPA